MRRSRNPSVPGEKPDGRPRRRAAVAFGSVLRERRVEMGLTQAALARRAATTRAYISSMERGEREPTIVALFRIADALDVAPSALLVEMERRLRQAAEGALDGRA